ncbi:MAG: cyclase family protein [Candidatus Aenigmatarchaeota archaeon]
MKEMIDLTYAIEEGMPIFNAPWHQKVEIKRLGKIDKEGRETRKITLGSHTGTHVDAPLHFIKGGKSVDLISPKKMFGEVDIIDLSSLEERAPITPRMLKRKIQRSRVIFKFGWGRRWGKNSFFEDYPYFTEEAAKFIIRKGVELIGLDTPSPDRSYGKLICDLDSPIHKILLSHEVVIVEYLANLEKVDTSKSWKLIVMPWKIKGAAGAPARVFVFR